MSAVVVFMVMVGEVFVLLLGLLVGVCFSGFLSVAANVNHSDHFIFPFRPRIHSIVPIHLDSKLILIELCSHLVLGP